MDELKKIKQWTFITRTLQTTRHSLWGKLREHPHYQDPPNNQALSLGQAQRTSSLPGPSKQPGTLSGASSENILITRTLQTTRHSLWGKLREHPHYQDPPNNQALSLGQAQRTSSLPGPSKQPGTLSGASSENILITRTLQTTRHSLWGKLREHPHYQDPPNNQALSLGQAQRTSSLPGPSKQPGTLSGASSENILITRTLQTTRHSLWGKLREHPHYQDPPNNQALSLGKAQRTSSLPGPSKQPGTLSGASSENILITRTFQTTRHSLWGKLREHPHYQDLPNNQALSLGQAQRTSSLPGPSKQPGTLSGASSENILITRTLQTTRHSLWGKLREHPHYQDLPNNQALSLGQAQRTSSLPGPSKQPGTLSGASSENILITRTLQTTRHSLWGKLREHPHYQDPPNNQALSLGQAQRTSSLPGPSKQPGTLSGASSENILITRTLQTTRHSLWGKLREHPHYQDPPNNQALSLGQAQRTSSLPGPSKQPGTLSGASSENILITRTFQTTRHSLWGKLREHPHYQDPPNNPALSLGQAQRTSSLPGPSKQPGTLSGASSENILITRTFQTTRHSLWGKLREHPHYQDPPNNQALSLGQAQRTSSLPGPSKQPGTLSGASSENILITRTLQTTRHSLWGKLREHPHYQDPPNNPALSLGQAQRTSSLPGPSKQPGTLSGASSENILITRTLQTTRHSLWGKLREHPHYQDPPNNPALSLGQAQRTSSLPGPSKQPGTLSGESSENILITRTLQTTRHSLWGKLREHPHYQDPPNNQALSLGQAQRTSSLPGPSKQPGTLSGASSENILITRTLQTTRHSLWGKLREHVNYNVG